MLPVIQPALRVDGQGERLRLLHVHAHPDDESSKGAATTARYVAEGVEVMVATCTGGERGSILNPNMDRPDVLANIAEIRRQEMDAARSILGIEQVWLGFVDSGLPEGSFATLDVDEASVPLVVVLRTFRPHVLTTYDERGGYPHPDHIQCHRISVAAYEHAADPEWHPELGPVWQTPKLYYSWGFHLEKTQALDAAMTARGLTSPYAERLRDWKRDPAMENRITTQVPCAEYFPVRDRALIAHATQIDPEGTWFQIPLELQREVWPTEDYQLVRSTVDTHLPEDDLFAGLARPAEPGDRPDGPTAP